MSDVFRALADPTRREILRVLRMGPQSAGVLADRFPQSRSTLSAHFNVLRAADLVQTERRGQTIYYRLNLSVMQEAIALVLHSLGAADAAAGRAGAAVTRRRRARA